MKSVSLSGSIRKNVGKKDASHLRTEGRIPAVLYGGAEQLHFHLSEIEMGKLVFSPNVYQYDLEIDGKPVKCVIQDIQFHPVTDRIVHIDFLELVDDKIVRIKLPVRLIGNSIGVRNGGKLRQNFRKLKVAGLPNALPESIEVNIEDLRIGQSIRVSDLNVEGVSFLDSQTQVVVGVKTARGAVDEDEEEGEEGEEGEASAEGGDAPAEGGEG